MGTYTTNFKLYKPAPDEVVDVNQQLNYNWDIADLNVDKLLDYQYWTAPSVSSVVGSSNRAGEKWYKTYSNCILLGTGPGSFSQDANAHVDSWVGASQYFTPAATPQWSQQPGAEVSYRIISSPGSPTTEIEWVGRVYIGGGSITTNTTYNVFTGVPVGVRPIVNKYFNVYGGNTTSDYAACRVLVGADGIIQFYKYGNGPGASGENYFDMGGVRYCVEVPA